MKRSPRPTRSVAGSVLLGLAAWLSPVAAAEPAHPTAPRGAEAYLRVVKPLFRERCYACHGALKQSAGLRLDTGGLARKGGDSGPAVEPGSPDDSPLIDRVTDRDPGTRMPPEGAPLSPDQVDALRQWIRDGAGSPEVESPEPDPREHWSFRVPVRPPLPSTNEPDWPLNPIDHFVAAEREARGLGHRSDADRATLLRRVSLDLTGLPPTRQELHAFLADESPDAYEKVVERLLESPRYGERWGRHFMDIWRYSDWYGRRMVPDVWNSAPQIWRWRDWIVRSFNDDKGYDRMVAEMLAGDEVAPADDANAVATGYLVRNWYALNPNQWMRDNVEHTGKAFLGLTFNCAHCHDHKYDPIKQTDYFGFRAFFEPIAIRQDRWPGEADPGPFQEYEYSVLRKIIRLGAVRIYDKKADAPTFMYTGGDERNRLTERGPIPPGVPAFLRDALPKIAPVNLPEEAYRPGLRPAILDAERRRLEADLRKAEAKRDKARAEIEGDAFRKAQMERDAASKEFDRVAAEAEAAGKKLGLEGRLSLHLDANRGRRILNNALGGLKPLGEGSSLAFLLQIRSDAHVNVQLAADAEQGRTAGVVVFEKERILSYSPGGTAEFQAGSYDTKAGQTLFRVTFAFAADPQTAKLTVVSVNDGKTLVDGVPVARNGWDPAKNPRQALTLDARPGAIVDFDAIAAGAGGNTLRFDFESPRYALGADVVGVEGWTVSALSKAPAKSFVTITAAGEAAVVKAANALSRASEEVDTQRLELRAAEARVASLNAERAALEARLAADREAKGPDGAKTLDSETARAAGRLEREAARAKAEADLLDARVVFARPVENMRSNSLDAIRDLRGKVMEAQAALDKADAALKTPPTKPPFYNSLSPTYPSISTGRRKALAGWIASRSNPLTARVAVNHVWARHMNAPIVSTVFDFGRNGAKPTNQGLIDWLAVEFMESGWSFKHLHRRIVTSRTYRMSSARGDAVADAERDPENLYLWRMNPGRLEAEAVRDALLMTAGVLDTTMGGQELENEQAPTTRRRSLYYSCHPEAGGKSEFGAIFDAADAGECYRRTRSVIPQQALALTNSPLIHDLSGPLAAKLWEEAGASQGDRAAAFINMAYEKILSRGPTGRERALCLDFLARGRGEARAREGVVRALYNQNDFLTVR